MVFSGDLYKRQRSFRWIHASGTGGEVCCIVSYCASTVEFSRSGGARGNGFRWIATFGGYIPEEREGKLAEPFSFALPPVNFHGGGGEGGAGFGESLRSAEALLVYACKLCREDERTDRFFIHLHILVSLTGGCCFRGICTICGGTFGGFMPLGREGKFAAPFPFALPPMNFHGTGGRWGGFGGSLSLADTCQRDGRENVLNRFLLRFRR